MAEDLRARLEALIAGKQQRPRGHAVTAAEFAAGGAFAKACAELVDSSNDDDDNAERVPVPSRSLPVLP